MRISLVVLPASVYVPAFRMMVLLASLLVSEVWMADNKPLTVDSWKMAGARRGSNSSKRGRQRRFGDFMAGTPGVLGTNIHSVAADARTGRPGRTRNVSSARPSACKSAGALA